MDAPLISVIVPVYKVEAYLDRCVQSIVDQTFINLEIILVDDGSPDNCPVMCDAWAQKDIRIKVIHKENGGLSDARNVGMALASGEYIGFVDSDDWITPDMYQHLHDLLDADCSDIAACGVEMVWEDGLPSRMLTKSGCCVLNQEEAMRAIIEESWLKQPVWYKLYKTALIRDIPFPVGRYHEDVFWSYQAVAKAQKVSVSDKVGYYYFQRSGSIMSEGYSFKRLDAIEAYCRRIEFVRQAYPALEKEALISLWASCIYNGQMALRFLQQQEEKSRVFSYLQKQIKQYPISHAYYRSKKLTHRIWLSMAKVSVRGACVVRNYLNIGF